MTLYFFLSIYLYHLYEEKKKHSQDSHGKLRDYRATMEYGPFCLPPSSWETAIYHHHMHLRSTIYYPQWCPIKRHCTCHCPGHCSVECFLFCFVLFCFVFCSNWDGWLLKPIEPHIYRVSTFNKITRTRLRIFSSLDFVSF
jgi:hypothetical protein